MLIQFSVENFRSIKDKATLSMVATEDSAHEENVVDAGCGLQLLKAAEIYGANGSGKSSLMEALVSIPQFAFGEKDVNHLYKPHFLKNRNDVTFEWDFEGFYELDFYTCHYEISLSEKGIEKELLVYSPYSKSEESKIVFSKKGNSLTLDDSLKGFASRLQSDKTIASQIWFNPLKTREAVPEILEPLYSFAHSITYTNNIGSLPYSNVIDRKEITIKISKLRETIKKEEYSEDFLHKLDDLTERLLSRPDYLDLTEWMNMCGVPVIEIKKDGTDCFFVYENGISVPLECESEGTKYLVRLFDTITEMGKDSGLIFCVDEIETHLHPLIVRKIVEQIHSLSNTFGLEAQMIFTTHNAELLDLSLVRRDQIWFTQMHDDRSTELYSLAEFKDVSENTDIHTWYLEGCYGGVPIIYELKNTKEGCNE